MAAADALRTLLFDLRAAHNRTDDDGVGVGVCGDGDVMDDGAGAGGEQGATQDGGDEAAGGEDAAAAGAGAGAGAGEKQKDEYSFDDTSIQILLRGNLTPTSPPQHPIQAHEHPTPLSWYSY